MAGRPPAKKCLSDALRIALNEPDATGQKKIRTLAEVLLNKALDGDMQAIKEVYDRVEGKPAQAVVGDEDNPLRLISEIRRVIVPSGHTDS